MIRQYTISFYVKNVTSGRVHNRKVILHDNSEISARLQAILLIESYYSSRSSLFEFKIINVRCNTLQPRVI